MFAILLFTILLILLFLSFFEDEEIRSQKWLMPSLCLLLAIFVAFRPAGIDNDYNTYLDFFKNPSGISALLTEPTFKMINALARFCGAPLLLFVVYAFLSVPLKVYAIKRLSPYWYLSILLWFSHLFIIQEMTQIRVAVSSAIFLFSLPLLSEGKKMKFICCLIFAILFHYSALILIPLFCSGINNSHVFGVVCFYFFLLLCMLFRLQEWMC